MKKIVFVVFMLASMAMSCTLVSAQNMVHRQRLTREQLAESQARHIAADLALDETVGKRFMETYINCQKDIWALGPRLRRNAYPSEEQSEQEIKQRFERSEKLLAIRQKYYKEYSKFLTQRQIQRMYEIEKNMKRRLMKRKTGVGTPRNRHRQ